MKEDVVSQTSERITAIIIDKMTSAKEDGIEVRLENIMDECQPQKLKLRLHILHKGVQSSQIVSSCLSLEEIGKIQEIVEKFCKMKQVKYRMKE